MNIVYLKFTINMLIQKTCKYKVQLPNSFSSDQKTL